MLPIEQNAYGSRNEVAARLAARIWTITATAELAGLNIITYLTAYLDACGRTGGKPPTGPDLQRFQPWTATPDDLHTGHNHLALANTPTNPVTAPPPRNGHAAPRYTSGMPPRDFQVRTLQEPANYSTSRRTRGDPRDDRHQGDP